MGNRDDALYQETITKTHILRGIKDGRARLLLELALLDLMEEQVRAADPKDQDRLQDLMAASEWHNDPPSHHQLVGPEVKEQYFPQWYGQKAVELRRKLASLSKDWTLRITPEMVKKAIAQIQK